MAFEKILFCLGLSYFLWQKKKLLIVNKIKLLTYLWHLHKPEKVTQKIQERHFYLILYHLELKTQFLHSGG